MKFLSQFFLSLNLLLLSLSATLFATTEECKNIFSSSIYQNYRERLQDFVLKSPLTEAVEKTASTSLNDGMKEFITQLKTIPSKNNLRADHESFIKKVRSLITLQSKNPNNPENSTSTLFLKSIVSWLFLSGDMQPEMGLFFFEHAPYEKASSASEDNFYDYLRKGRDAIHANADFNGVQHSSGQGDQLLEGNLPSKIANVSKGATATLLIRCGQPSYYTSRTLWWWRKPVISEEFLFFLENQPSHLYVNLMKRHGLEKNLTHNIEELENKFPHFYAISLDKNSSFYQQKDQIFQQPLEAATFKALFLNQMIMPNKNFFWSSHLNKVEWKEELETLLNQMHTTLFKEKKTLDRQERLDFIELTYLAILDLLVEKWQPASMNITCRQCMDRAPSLIMLWIYQKNLMNTKDLAAWLLAPPVIVYNRSSHSSRIERFISAAQRIESLQKD